MESVAKLLREVEDFVPVTERSRTLVALGATAGVRLLPDHESGPLITGVNFHICICTLKNLINTVEKYVTVSQVLRDLSVMAAQI